MPFTLGGEWIPSKNDQTPQKKVVVLEQKKKGKFVTLVHNLSQTEEELKELVRYLKQKCHCGGTLREECIELQGCKKEEVLKALKEYPKKDLNL